MHRSFFLIAAVVGMATPLLLAPSDCAARSGNSGSGIFETARHNFTQAARRLKLDPAMRDRLMHPQQRIELSLNPQLPSGRTVHVPAFIVLHNVALGPAKGGIRMTPDVTLDDVAGLAMEMTWKPPLMQVPFGGGKAGIRWDRRRHPSDDTEAVIRSFARAASPYLGPELYIGAPDQGTNASDMGHIQDCISYSRGVSIPEGCYVTGKPLLLGGIEGRREATGTGVVHTIRALYQNLGLELAGARVAIQGFGNVGSVAAMELARRQARVVGVADISGGVFRKQGLDVAALLAHTDHKGGVRGFRGGTAMHRRAVLEMDCDLLLLAAGGSQITEENAGRVRARVLAEGGNATITPQGDRGLRRRSAWRKHGVLVIPDLLCNAGGLFGSYLEYTQEMQRDQMTLAEVNARLEQRMMERFQAVWEDAHAKRTTMRQAAMDLAVGRVVQATLERGFLP